MPDQPDTREHTWPARLERRFDSGLGRLEAHSASAGVDSVRAVHEFRKELRRLRSIVRLLRSPLPAEDLAPIEGDLRTAFRETNALRDREVLNELLRGSGVGKAGRRALQRAFASATPAAEGTSVSPPTAPAVSEVLAAASSRVRGALTALANVLSDEVDERQLRAGVERRMKRAVHAWKRVNEHARDEDVHDWRKRAKEVRYGLEWLAEEGAAEPRAAKPWARLAKRLGRITDLLILIEAIDGLPKAQRRDVRRVRKDLRRRVLRRIRKALRESRELMERTEG